MPAGLAADPVCGMAVEVDLAVHKSEFEGVTYLFCGPGCKKAFDDDPVPYRDGIAATPPELRDRKPIRKHVLICGGGDCAKRGQEADKMRRQFRRELFRIGRLHGGTLPGDIRVATTSCVGGCGNGPMLAVYPEGVFYGGVRSTDVDRIIRDHLLNDTVIDDRYLFRTMPASEVPTPDDRNETDARLEGGDDR